MSDLKTIVDSAARNGGISLYNETYSQFDEIKNTGYDYTKTLFKKSSSPYLFRNQRLADFIAYLNDIYVEYIESVKKIRVFYNYTVPKDYRKIN
jgi:hypothetical protein